MMNILEGHFGFSENDFIWTLVELSGAGVSAIPISYSFEFKHDDMNALMQLMTSKF